MPPAVTRRNITWIAGDEGVHSSFNYYDYTVYYYELTDLFPVDSLLN